MHINTWHEAIVYCEQQGCAYVIVTVLQSAGSTPRDAGTKMLITGDSQYDTIGGGHLEYQASMSARRLLANNKACQEIESYPLSSKLGQCCGGAVKLLFEVMVNHRQHLAIFGGGHVAQALVPIMAQLPLQISWIDSRDNFFGNHLEHPAGDIKNADEKFAMHSGLPSSVANKAQQIVAALNNVKAIASDSPCEIIDTLPDFGWVVILTHNHQLDYEIVETALKHPNLVFIGMIGSTTKAKRFVTKLAHRGFSKQQISRLVCPIGERSITGKRPIEVAVSISAQLINLLNANKLIEAEKIMPSGKILDSESQSERLGINADE
jgi:xanthine dehydrogenase accessory factor